MVLRVRTTCYYSDYCEASEVSMYTEFITIYHQPYQMSHLAMLLLLKLSCSHPVHIRHIRAATHCLDLVMTEIPREHNSPSN